MAALSDPGFGAVPTSLGDRMKYYESLTVETLPANHPALFRVDGHGFSKFTRGFTKPFDERLHSAMAATSADLISYFSEATLVYTQSDEITIAFPTGCMAFNGRVQKLASLAAGYTTVRFNHHLMRLVPDLEEGKRGVAHFDARVFSVPNVGEILNNLLWRRNDCRRNSIHGFGRSFFGHHELTGLGSDAIVGKVLREKGVDFWTSTPTWARYGTSVKRERHEGVGIDGITKEEVKVVRTRTCAKDVVFDAFNEDNLALVAGRFWDR